MDTGHHSRFVLWFCCLPALHGAFGLASMGVPVGTANTSMAVDPGLRGVNLTRVLIRNGDRSANGIAPIAIRDRATGVLAVRDLRNAPLSAASAVARTIAARST